MTTVDPVHGRGWNTADRWGGWRWRKPERGEHFRRCSFCGSIHPEDLAAEQAGDDICRVCAKHGWEACFRNQQPPWVNGDERAAVLAQVSPEERAQVEAQAPAHSYSPGGWWASWADQKYGWPHKFYVEGLSNRDTGALFVVAVQSGGQARPPEPAAGKDGIGWVAFADLTRQQRKIAERDGWVARQADHSAFYQFGTRTSHFAKFYTVHLADPAISGAAKETIQRVCGLRFEWSGDGQIRWSRYQPPGADTETQHGDH